MTTAIKRRRGTTAQHATFTGLEAELTVDTTKKTVVVHDGATAGGIPLAKETGSAISASSLTLPNGTANGVAYLNGSKVLTTGSALTFDGTRLLVGRATSDANNWGIQNYSAASAYASGLQMVYGGVGAAAMWVPAASSLAFGADVGAGTTEQMRLTLTGLGIGTSLPAYKLDVGATTNGFLHAQVRNLSNGSSATSSWSLGNDTNATAAAMFLNSSTNGSFGGANSLNIYNGLNAPIAFYTNAAERMRIDSSGNLLVGTTATWGALVNINATYNGMRLRNVSASGSPYMIAFDWGTTNVGSIASTSTATSYNTSSDYRLKENIQPMQNALGVVAQLNPVTYTWKADGSDGQGFIAHELQAVVPDCVTGEKDAVDAKGKPVYQGIDTSFLIATLTKAIQEQQELINQLTARVAQLEGQ